MGIHDHTYDRTCATTPHVRSVYSSLEDWQQFRLIGDGAPLKHPGANTLPVLFEFFGHSFQTKAVLCDLTVD